MTTVLDPHLDTPQKPPETPLTFEQFLAWVDEDDYAEWVDGEVVFKGTESAAHQDLLGFLVCALGSYVEDHDAGEFSTSPYLMKLTRSARAPDVMFIAKENEHRLQEYFLNGPADLAIEIVSPSSATRDRGAKYGEYEAGGVREYWIIAPDTKRADFFVLDEDGRYQRARPDADGNYQSAVLPGFWINVGWLWQSPLPPVRQVLKAWEEQGGRGEPLPLRVADGFPPCPSSPTPPELGAGGRSDYDTTKHHFRHAVGTRRRLLAGRARGERRPRLRHDGHRCGGWPRRRGRCLRAGAAGFGKRPGGFGTGGGASGRRRPHPHLRP